MAIDHLFDENMDWIGPPQSPAAKRKALRMLQSANRQDTTDDYDERERTSLYTRIKRDEALYAANLLQRHELHRDADPIEIFDLARVARDYLSMAGAEMPPRDQSLLTITRALDSSDFSSLLSSIMNKALVLGYRQADVTWPLFTVTRTVPDYKSFLALRGATMRIPPKVPENSEIQYGGLLDEGSESGAVESYSQRISISRQALANVDIEQITLTPYSAGQSISRLINKLVFDLLTSSPVLSDGLATFDASTHGNLITSGGAPSATTLDEACATMGAQVNAASEPLNIRPYCVLAPHSLATSLQILRSAINPYDFSGLSTNKVITATDSRLSGNAWYAIADPMRHPGIAVVTLQGSEDRPRIEEQTGAPPDAPDGRHWLVGHDVAAIVVDHKALFRNDGA